MERRRIGALSVSLVGLGCNNAANARAIAWHLDADELTEIDRLAPPWPAHLSCLKD